MHFLVQSNHAANHLAHRALAIRQLRFVVALTVACCLISASTASAATVADNPAFPLGQVFTILFLMLGPFKVVGPFLRLTKGADARLTRRVALWATLFSALALLIAGFLGETLLVSYGVPLDVLRLSGGIILFLVALKNVLEQFESPEPHTSEVTLPPEAVMRVALRPLAFPGVVTPYGIAALVVFLAFSQSVEGRLAIGGIVVAIMALNLVFMLAARRLQVVFALALPILGAVLGVVQVALGLQIINIALRALGVL